MCKWVGGDNLLFAAVCSYCACSFNLAVAALVIHLSTLIKGHFSNRKQNKEQEFCI